MPPNEFKLNFFPLKVFILICAQGMGEIEILSHSALLNEKESTINRALGGSTYPV
jgi:hypothetical protein